MCPCAPPWNPGPPGEVEEDLLLEAEFRMESPGEFDLMKELMIKNVDDTCEIFAKYL